MTVIYSMFVDQTRVSVYTTEAASDNVDVSELFVDNVFSRRV